MQSTVDELTIQKEVNGQVIVKELDKRALTTGAWTTIVYKYQDWNRKKDAYNPEKYAIRRYHKKYTKGDENCPGQYFPKTKFNISSKAQARALISILSEWLEEN